MIVLGFEISPPKEGETIEVKALDRISVEITHRIDNENMFQLTINTINECGCPSSDFVE